MNDPRIGWRLRLMLWIIRIFQGPLSSSNLDRLKKRSNSRFTAYFYDIVRAKVARVEDFSLPSGNQKIDVRLYHPHPGYELPVILYFHGGGFVLGGINSYDHFCRKLSCKTGCAVVSVGYRLAPEHKFPAAHEDSVSVLAWIIFNKDRLDLDVNDIFLGGDSAGGNLAASLAFHARQTGISIRGTVLIYPSLDFSASSGPYYERLLMSRQDGEWFVSHFLDAEENQNDPRLTLKSNQDLTNLPDSIIIQAEYDHLNPEIDNFHKLLIANQNSSELVQVKATIHGFITMMNWTPEANKTLDRINHFIGNKK